MSEPLRHHLGVDAGGEGQKQDSATHTVAPDDGHSNGETEPPPPHLDNDIKGKRARFLLPVP